MDTQKVTMTEATKLAGVSRTLLWRRIREGELVATRSPRDRRVQLLDRTAIEQYFDIVKGDDDMHRAA